MQSLNTGSLKVSPEELAFMHWTLRGRKDSLYCLDNKQTTQCGIATRLLWKVAETLFG